MNKYSKKVIFIVSAILFCIFAISIHIYMDERDMDEVKSYQPMVEASFKDGKFTQEKKVVDDSLRYTITVEANTIVLKYSMMAEKGRQLTRVNMNVEKMGGLFVWSCQKDVLILPKYDC